MMDTKKEAEEKALEFAIECLLKGDSVRMLSKTRANMFTTWYNNCDEYRNFPFVDVEPGDACIVWDSSERLLRMFSHMSDDGRLVFCSGPANIGSNACGRIFKNYRKLGFNVLELGVKE